MKSYYYLSEVIGIYNFNENPLKTLDFFKADSRTYMEMQKVKYSSGDLKEKKAKKIALPDMKTYYIAIVI